MTATIASILAVYACLLAPGHGWWTARASALPSLFARVIVSSAWTTIAACALTLFDAFTIERLVAVNLAGALSGFFVTWGERSAPARLRHRRRAGGVIAVIALTAYWPAFETHLGAGDSSAYLAAGTHLAANGTLWKTDPLGASIPGRVAGAIFPPVEFRTSGQVYQRTAG